MKCGGTPTAVGGMRGGPAQSAALPLLTGRVCGACARLGSRSPKPAPPAAASWCLRSRTAVDWSRTAADWRIRSGRGDQRRQRSKQVCKTCLPATAQHCHHPHQLQSPHSSLASRYGITSPNPSDSSRCEQQPAKQQVSKTCLPSAASARVSPSLWHLSPAVQAASTSPQARCRARRPGPTRTWDRGRVGPLQSPSRLHSSETCSVYSEEQPRATVQ